MLCSRGADELGKIFLEAEIPYVVVVRCYDLTEDITAEKFLETFFLSMLRSDSIEKSYKDARDSILREKANKVLSPTVCCCFHQHKPTCRMTEMIKNVGLARVIALIDIGSRTVPYADVRVPS